MVSKILSIVIRDTDKQILASKLSHIMAQKLDSNTASAQFILQAYFLRDHQKDITALYPLILSLILLL